MFDCIRLCTEWGLLASWLGSCIAKQGPESLLHVLVQAELLNGGSSSPVDNQDWEELQAYDGLLAQGSAAAEGEALAAAQLHEKEW